MTVIDVAVDRAARTLVLTAEYRAPVERVWQLWADPRLLERWWGPPTYPATIVDHDLTVDGRVTYYMTGPEGDQHHAWWEITAVDAPDSLEFDDRFADDGLPASHVRVRVADAGDGVTRMVITTTFPSPEAMDQVLAMGHQEGVIQSLNQADGLLAAAVER
jgi:uncharacterized protein YndB with AHSA1/START domain